MNLCIYHGGCTDGVAAATAVHLGSRDYKFYPGVYQQEPPWDLIERAREVWLVDFSYKLPVMEEIIQRVGAAVAHTEDWPLMVGVLDHHASAERELQPLLDSGEVYGQFDMTRCGALMAWDHFRGGPRPPLLPYIDARDRWVKDADLEYDLDHVIMGLRSYPHTDPIDFELWARLLFDPKALEEEGRAIHRYYRLVVDAAKARAVRVNFSPLGQEGWGSLPMDDVPCVSASFEFASEIAGELAADAECGWAFVWWQTSDGSYTASLRSRAGGPDVSRIAETFGGGGHPGAAGFRCDERVWAIG